MRRITLIALYPCKHTDHVLKSSTPLNCARNVHRRLSTCHLGASTAITCEKARAVVLTPHHNVNACYLTVYSAMVMALLFAGTAGRRGAVGGADG